MDTEANAPQAEHRIRLLQALDRRQDMAPLGERHRIRARLLELLDLHGDLKVAGEELVQRRIDQAHDHRQPVHRLEEAVEVLALVLQQGRETVRDDLRVVLGENHPLHDRHALGLEEHVLGTAEADALPAVFPRPFRVGRIVGIRPDLQAALGVGPGKKLQ